MTGWGALIEPFVFRRLALVRQGWLGLVLLAVILLGATLRFINLGGKVYWHDEAYTSLWLSGHNTGHLADYIFREGEAGTADLRKYQQLYPGRGLPYVLMSLAVENPQHVPLYYSLLWLWAHLIGDSVAALRLFSAVVSVLALPLMYWLGRELFGSERVGWVAAALLAVSPYHVLYAQEARPYSLWTVTILASTLGLLWAVRSGRRRVWLMYAALAAAGLYTHLLFLMVLAVHGVWVVAGAGKRPGRAALREYSRAGLLALAAFLPWVAVILWRWSTLYETYLWLARVTARQFSVRYWLLGLGSLFADLPQAWRGWLGGDPASPALYVPSVICLVLVGYSLWDLWRRAPREPAWLVVLLAALPFLTLAVPDVLFGGRRSLFFRYFVPSYVAVHLSVSHLLATRLEAPRLAWRLATAALLAAGLASSAINLSLEVTWNKDIEGRQIQATARILNACPRPLVVADPNSGPFPHLLALSLRLERDVRFRFVRRLEAPGATGGFSHVFVFSSARLDSRRPVRPGGYGLEPVPGSRYLYRLIE